ncbi:hypothetical protein QOZ80_8BG0643020 [Eleusine coracana subsp. coracana]|nr:hypothetical protein QOZ80_8BG0643020 [Eleusine coracana subsp. coracana]
MEHESVFGGSGHLRQFPEWHHDCLKSVEIIGFSSVKGLVELTCCIIKNSGSLEHLVLDTLPRHGRCSGENSIRCCPISKTLLQEAFRTIRAIRTYIADKVPATAKLTIKEPCARCHSLG